MSICTRLLNRTKHEFSCINVNCTRIKSNTKIKFSTPLSKNKNFCRINYNISFKLWILFKTNWITGNYWFNCPVYSVYQYDISCQAMFWLLCPLNFWNRSNCVFLFPYYFIKFAMNSLEEQWRWLRHWWYMKMFS